MKITRRDFLLVSSSACLLTQNIKAASAQTRHPAPAAKAFSPTGRKVVVYTTQSDTELRSCSVMHSTKTGFTVINQPLLAAGDKLTIFTTTWSPPAFMKSKH